MCCKSRGLSRMGLLWGLLALATLLLAFVNGSWLLIKEPMRIPKTDRMTSVTFRIGLWRVCPNIKRVNLTNYIGTGSYSCSTIKYSGWKEVKSEDLHIPENNFELTPIFLSRMRSCTVLSSAAVVLLALGFIFALLGNCSGDNKTLVASGMFILGALLLGTGLVVFASALSETFLEVTQYGKESLNGPLYDYRYGWCFFTAAAAFVMTKLAAVFSLSGYLNRFPSIDEMVRLMVPGAERKLREHQRHLDYLDKHLHMGGAGPAPIHHHTTTSTGGGGGVGGGTPRTPHYDPPSSRRPNQHSYDPCSVSTSAECGRPLLNRTPPDLCTSNKCMYTTDDGDHHQQQQQQPLPESHSYDSNLAGQTIPIMIKSQHLIQPPLAYANNKYGTLPSGVTGGGGGGASYQDKCKTLSHSAAAAAAAAAARKKCVKIESFQCPDASGFCDFSGGSAATAAAASSKRGNVLAYSGSAV